MATEVRTITKPVRLSQLQDEVNADPTISGQPAVCTRILFESPDQFTFFFDVALTGGSPAALDAVIAAHNPTGPGDPPVGGFFTKAGDVLVGAFSGTPKKASVVFATPFPEGVDYVITYAIRTGNDKTHYIPVTSAQAQTGFTVSLGTGSTTNLTSVCWHALAIGEA